MNHQPSLLNIANPPPTSRLIPVRLLNEFVYCPRLAYLEWIQSEFQHNTDTLEGSLKHQTIDKKESPLPIPDESLEKIQVRSVTLSSETLGIIGKIDLVEKEGKEAIPIDYKKGKRPHVAGHVWDPERVQLCAQALLLQEHGYQCNKGYIYFMGSHERVPVPITPRLIHLTLDVIRKMHEMAQTLQIPPPLEDSPKCPRCSLLTICLPDEIRFLNQPGGRVRPIIPANEFALPLYVTSPYAKISKEGYRLKITEDDTVHFVRIADISRVHLYGWSSITTPALHELLRRGIPVTYTTSGGWFIGHTISTGHPNIDIRIAQFRTAEDTHRCLKIARALVSAKILNCRTLLRRNWKPDQESNEQRRTVLSDLKSFARRALTCESIDSLLGIEGAAASLYFRHFGKILNPPGTSHFTFDFTGRNRRPPKDPVNAMLSLAYAMLCREWTLVLSGVGLDPYLGFYHQPRFGKPALALDMMEPFRPLIADSVVLRAINEGSVRQDDFQIHPGGCLMTRSGRKRFIAVYERRMNQLITHPIFGYRISYRRILEVQARLLIRYLTGEIPRFPMITPR